MATPDEVAALRLMIDEAEDTLPYTDVLLGSRLDAAGSREGLAAQIWREKAAAAASLVNVSESGSSRSLSDLHDNALAMAQHFASIDPTAPGAAGLRGVRMSRLTR